MKKRVIEGTAQLKNSGSSPQPKKGSTMPFRCECGGIASARQVNGQTVMICGFCRKGYTSTPLD